MTALTRRWNSNMDFRSEEISYNELTTSYKELCNKSDEVYQIGIKQRMIIANLWTKNEEFLADISELQNEVTLLTSKLDNLIKVVRMSNNGSYGLDDIIQDVEGGRRHIVLGFNYQSLKNKKQSPEIKFVHAKLKDDSKMFGKI